MAPSTSWMSKSPVRPSPWASMDAPLGTRISISSETRRGPGGAVLIHTDDDLIGAADDLKSSLVVGPVPAPF